MTGALLSVNNKRVDLPLVAGYRTAHKPLPLHVSRWANVKSKLSQRNVFLRGKGVCPWKKQEQGGGASRVTAACQSEDSPERVDLTGLLHGDPGADETGDEAAGEREDRTGEDRVEGGGAETEAGATARSATVHRMLPSSLIHHNLIVHF